MIERVAGKFFFSPLLSSRGIRDDIEEEDDQVSDPLDVTTAIVSLPQHWLCPNPFSIFLPYTLYIYTHTHISLQIESLKCAFGNRVGAKEHRVACF